MSGRPMDREWRLEYEVIRMLAAIEAAVAEEYTYTAELAEQLAYEHAVEAARAARQ